MNGDTPQVTFEQVTQMLTSMDPLFRADSDRPVLMRPFAATTGPFVLFVELDDRREVIDLVVPSIVHVPPERRAVVGQVIGHLNYQILLGKYVLDARDGEVQFRLTIPYFSVGTSQMQLRTAIGFALHMLQDQLQTVFRAVFSAEPVHAVLGLENQTSLGSLLDRLRQGLPEPDEAGDEGLAEPA